MLAIRSEATGPSPASTSQSSTEAIGSARAPSDAPSKVVAPIVSSTSATEPGAATHLVAADSGRRRPSVPSRTSSGARLANMPK